MFHLKKLFSHSAKNRIEIMEASTYAWAVILIFFLLYGAVNLQLWINNSIIILALHLQWRFNSGNVFVNCYLLPAKGIQRQVYWKDQNMNSNSNLGLFCHIDRCRSSVYTIESDSAVRSFHNDHDLIASSKKKGSFCDSIEHDV